MGQSIVNMNNPILLHIGSSNESNRSLASIFPRISYFTSDFDVEEKARDAKEDLQTLTSSDNDVIRVDNTECSIRII